MSDTMSAAEIEALFAQDAADSSAASGPSVDDAAAAVQSPAEAAAQGAPVPPPESASEPSSDVAPEPVSDGMLDDASESALPDLVKAGSAPAPETSREPEADPVSMASTADAALTDTAATRAGATALDVTSDEPAPDEPDPSDDAQGGTAAHTTIGDLFAQYGKYVALFVGAGLISGSVVHFPLAPVRYAIIGAVGALVFAIASVVSELGDRDPLRLLRVALSSLALALGIGMISGGIQHFMDIPQRAAVLIPLGVVLSLAAFGSRHGLRMKRVDLAVIVPWLIIGVFALGFGLSQLAGIASAQGGGAGHGHESGATEGGGAAGAGAEEHATDDHGGGAAGAGHGEDSAETSGAGDEDEDHEAASADKEDAGHDEEDAAHVEEEAHDEDAAHHQDDAAAGQEDDAQEGASGDEASSRDSNAGEDTRADAGGSSGPERVLGHDDGADEERVVLVP